MHHEYEAHMFFRKVDTYSPINTASQNKSLHSIAENFVPYVTINVTNKRVILTFSLT